MTDAELEALDAAIAAAGAVAAAAVDHAKQARARKSHPRLRVVARAPSSAPPADARDQIRRQSPVTRRGPPDPDPIRRLHLVRSCAPHADAELAAEQAISGAQ